MEMEEKLKFDNNAFFENNIVPSGMIDNKAAVLIDGIDKLENSDHIMDKSDVNLKDNLTNNSITSSSNPISNHLLSNGNSKSNLVSNDSFKNSTYDFKLNEVFKDEFDKNSKQQINGFTGSTESIMNNSSKLKRSDNQLNETNSSDLDEKIIKKICNNNTKTLLTINHKQSNDDPSSSSSINNSSTLKEETNSETSFSDNTELSDHFESENEELTEEEENTEGLWDCSVCTFRNVPETFKCQMCDVRKTTNSTRKPRMVQNPKLLAQQVAKQQEQIQKEAIKAKEKNSITKEKSKNNSDSSKRKPLDLNLEPMSPTSSTCSSKSMKKEKKDKQISKEENQIEKKLVSKNNFQFKLKDVDRSSGISNSITVENVTVVITEFQLKKPLDSESNKTKNGKKTSPNKNKS